MVRLKKGDVEYNMIKRALQSQSLFGGLDEENIEAFIENLELREYNPGDYIINQDDANGGKDSTEGKCFYIVSEGELDVIDEDRRFFLFEPNRLTTMFSLTRGHNFGIGAFFFNRARSATVRAKTPVKCWALERNKFFTKVLDRNSVRQLYDSYASQSYEDNNINSSAPGNELIHFKPVPGTIMIFPGYLEHEFAVDFGNSPFRFIHWNIQAVPKGMAKDVN